MLNFTNINLNNSHIKWKKSSGNRDITSAKYFKNEHVQASDNNNGFISHTYLDENGNERTVTPYPKQRPLKIYRKAYSSINSKSGISAINIFDKPGLSTTKYNEESDCNNCNTNIFNVNIINNDNSAFSSGTKVFEPRLNKIVCHGACNPELNIIKSASTIISPNYSYNTSQLLYRRNKTFDQNFSPKILTKCISDNGKLCNFNPPEYKSAGQNKSKNTHQNNINCTNLNNYSSVSSSSRIARLKYDTTRKYKNNTSNYQQQINKVNFTPSQCRNNTNLIFNKFNHYKPCSIN